MPIRVAYTAKAFETDELLQARAFVGAHPV